MTEHTVPCHPQISRGRRAQSTLGAIQRGLYVGLGLAMGLGLAAHGVGASSVSTPCRSGGPPAHPVALSHPAHQAQLFVAGQHRWRLALTGVTVVQHLQSAFATARARGQYVVVFVTAQNVGKQPQTLGFDQNFALVDAQGRQFGLAGSDPTIAAYQQYKLDSYWDAVQPTFNARVALVFDVAADAHGFALVNAPPFGGSTQKVFTLGI